MQTLPLIKRGLLNNKGFTLVEVIIVMMILSVVMTAVLSLVVPAQRSTTVQSDLSTVQGGMRVALERVTKDFRNAGFLFAGAPITSGGYPVNTTPSETVTVDASVNPLTINTKAVSGVFGRVAEVPTSTADTFDLVYPAQSRNFPVDSYAAVVEPVNGLLLGDNSVPGNVYRVIASNSAGTVQLGKHDGNPLDSIAPFSGAVSGPVLLRVPNADVPAIVAAGSVPDANAAAEAALNRTITFSHADTDGDGNADTLTRQVDGGSVSYLARGISDLTFTIQEDGDGDASMVTINLVGESIGLGDDAISSEKIKRSRITVTLRNY